MREIIDDHAHPCIDDGNSKKAIKNLGFARAVNLHDDGSST
jgi:hypothetical protein